MKSKTLIAAIPFPTGKLDVDFLLIVCEDAPASPLNISELTP